MADSWMDEPLEASSPTTGSTAGTWMDEPIAVTVPEKLEMLKRLNYGVWEPSEEEEDELFKSFRPLEPEVLQSVSQKQTEEGILTNLQAHYPGHSVIDIGDSNYAVVELDEQGNMVEGQQPRLLMGAETGLGDRAKNFLTRHQRTAASTLAGTGGAVLGGGIGAMIGGPPGAAIGALIGGGIGTAGAEIESDIRSAQEPGEHRSPLESALNATAMGLIDAGTAGIATKLGPAGAAVKTGIRKGVSKAVGKLPKWLTPGAHRRLRKELGLAGVSEAEAGLKALGDLGSHADLAMLAESNVEMQSKRGLLMKYYPEMFHEAEIQRTNVIANKVGKVMEGISKVDFSREETGPLLKAMQGKAEQAVYDAHLPAIKEVYKKVDELSGGLRGITGKRLVDRFKTSEYVTSSKEFLKIIDELNKGVTMSRYKDILTLLGKTKAGKYKLIPNASADQNMKFGKQMLEAAHQELDEIAKYMPEKIQGTMLPPHRAAQAGQALQEGIAMYRTMMEELGQVKNSVLDTAIRKLATKANVPLEEITKGGAALDFLMSIKAVDNRAVTNFMDIVRRTDPEVADAYGRAALTEFLKKVKADVGTRIGRQMTKRWPGKKWYDLIKLSDALQESDQLDRVMTLIGKKDSVAEGLGHLKEFLTRNKASLEEFAKNPGLVPDITTKEIAYAAQAGRSEAAKTSIVAEFLENLHTKIFTNPEFVADFLSPKNTKLLAKLAKSEPGIGPQGTTRIARELLQALEDTESWEDEPELAQERMPRWHYTTR